MKKLKDFYEENQNSFNEKKRKSKKIKGGTPKRLKQNFLNKFIEE